MPATVNNMVKTMHIRCSCKSKNKLIKCIFPRIQYVRINVAKLFFCFFKRHTGKQRYNQNLMGDSDNNNTDTHALQYTFTASTATFCLCLTSQAF